MCFSSSLEIRDRAVGRGGGGGGGGGVGGGGEISFWDRGNCFQDEKYCG